MVDKYIMKNDKVYEKSEEIIAEQPRSKVPPSISAETKLITRQRTR